MTPDERSQLFTQVEEQLRKNEGERALEGLDRLISVHPEDLSLLYLATRVCNVLGCETDYRDRLFRNADWPETAPPVPPLQFLAPATREPILSLVTSTWNRANSLSRLLDSLGRHTGAPFELIVSDNNSADGTLEMLAQRRTTFPWLGAVLFSGHSSTLDAYRTGTERARGRMIGYLADDLEVEPHWDRQITETLISRSEVGIATPVVLDPGRQTGFLGSCVPYVSRRHPWLNRHGTSVAADDSTPMSVTLPDRPMEVEGAAYPFLRRDLLTKVPIFDPRFIHVWDNDLALEMRSRGYRIQVCPQSRVIDHDASRSESDERQVVHSETFFEELYANPDRALSRLASPDSRPMRYLHDDFLLECKWTAFRVAPCSRGRRRAFRATG